jgi:hypothetical protein
MPERFSSLKELHEKLWKKTRRKKGAKKRKTRKRKRKRKKTRRKKKKGGCFPNCFRKATRVVPESIVVSHAVNTGQYPTYGERNATTDITIQQAHNAAYDSITGRPNTPWSPSQFNMIRNREIDQHNDAVNNYINKYPQATPVSESARPISRGLWQPDIVYTTGIVPSGTGGGLFKGKSTISTNFESGNINHIKNVQRKKDVLVVLEIENEPYPKNTKKKYQNWFYFKSNDVQRKAMTYTIQNINVFGNDWEGFNVCYSYDNKNWKRIKTSFSKKNKTLTWKHRSTKKNVYFAYYPPYTTVMNNTLINKYKNRKGVKHIVLNKNIDTLLLGTGPLHIYIVARQHPGETIGSWMAEGFLKAYFSSKQRKVIEKTFTIYIIPMANPTGVKSGHWYTNKKGQNLNRSWRHNKTPETTAIKKLMNFGSEGILYLDLHGDEGASKHFITTCIEKKNTVRESFNKIMGKFCPNFQLKDYYKRKGHKVYGTMDCFDKKKTLTIEGAMKHPLYEHKTLQDEGIKIGEAIYKTITNKIGCVCIDN